MELQEAIRKRRSVRKYKDTPVPREILEKLMESACWAPSADNKQGWYFVVLTQQEDIARLKETMQQVADGITPHLEATFPQYPEIVREVTTFLRRLGNAPVYVLVFLQDDSDLRLSMFESVAAAIENLLLSAHEQGLGTCWIGAVDSTGYGPALQEVFAPDKGQFVSLITLGYPESVPATPRRKPGRWEIR